MQTDCERVNGFQAAIRLDVLGHDGRPHVGRDLEVILLLAHERVIRDGEVEAFVGFHSVCDAARSGYSRKSLKLDM